MLQPVMQARSTPRSDYQHTVLPEHIWASGATEWISVQAFSNERYPKMAGGQSGIIRTPIWGGLQLLSVLFRFSESSAFGKSMRLQDRKHPVGGTGEKNQSGMRVRPSSQTLSLVLSVLRERRLPSTRGNLLEKITADARCNLLSHPQGGISAQRRQIYGHQLSDHPGVLCADSYAGTGI